MRKTILLLTCILLLTAVPALLAQTVNGTLSGKITNASGAAVANAAVTATNIATNAQQKVLTGPDGGFAFNDLPPGTYRIDVESQGYKHTTQQNITLITGGPTPVNITLEAGSMAETVELKGHAPAVQTATGEMALGVDTRTVHELPIIDRNYQQLVGLQTGVTPPGTAYDMARDPDRNRFFSVNGQMPWNNQWMMDGVMNQEPFRNTAVRVQPVETIQQLDVETAALRAQNGFAGGGVQTAITPGGTNGFHGDLFDFYSGDLLRTRDFFQSPGTPTPRFVYNQMGAAAGGALKPDKTFIFGSYEGTFANGDNTQLTTVPTPQMLTGNFSAVPGLVLYNPYTGLSTGAGRTPFAGNVIPSNLLNPNAVAIARFMPAPNLPGFFNNYTANTPFRDNQEKADGRLDQHFSDRTSMFLRYGYTNDWSAQASPLGSVIGSGASDRLLAQNAIGDFAHAFSPSLITDFRFGYNRYDQRLLPFDNAAPLGSRVGVPSLSNNLIGINITGFSAIGTPAYAPEHGVDNTFNWVWDWGWHTSHHNVKWGVDVRRIRSDGFTDSLLGSMFGVNGSAYFGPGATAAFGGPGLGVYGAPYNSFAGFLLGAPTQVGVVNYLTTPTIRQTESGVWLGDTIQPFHRLTIDLGVRYEMYSPIEPRNAGGAMFFNGANNSFNFAGIGANNMHGWTYDTDAVAPRAGLAFRATNKTVIRAGYGWQYFQQPYNLMGIMPTMFGSTAGVMGGFGVATPRGAFGPTVTSTTPIPGTLVNGAAAGNLPAAVVPRYIDTPYVQSFDAQVQQEFYWGTVLSVGYVGSLGRHLPYIEQLNAGVPGTGLAGLPFAAMGRTASTLLYTDGLTSNYNALQVSLNKRFAQNLSFTASYTWSRALGYTDNNNVLLDPFNLRNNYGPLDFNRSNVLTISHVWELPFGHHGGTIAQTLLGGWQLNGIFTWASGTPLTATADELGCNCLNLTPFANLNGNPYANNGNAILNPGAFSAPVNTFGNLGRGTLLNPGFKNYDMSLFKNFHVHDRYNLQLRGEAYNLTNTPHFMPPVANASMPVFGQQVGTEFGSFGRQVNLGLRLMF